MMKSILKTNFIKVAAFSLLAFSFSCKDHNTEQVAQTAEIQQKPKPQSDTLLYKKFVYITVDDGPVPGSDTVMHIADRYHIPVTSFLIGVHVNKSKENRRIYDELVKDSLIEICNHSFTHANYNHYNSFYNNPQMVIADFNRTQDSLKIPMKIARTPGRNIWRLPGITMTDNKKSIGVADALAKDGYHLVGWDVEWQGTKSQQLKGTADDLMKEITHLFETGHGKTPNHIVLLTHDRFLRDAESAKQFALLIEKLKSTNEYGFRKISDYPAISQLNN